MQKRIWIGAAALLFALAAASGMAVKNLLRAEGYEARLREVYDGAVLSALRQLEDMELSLSKALLSDPGAESEYLGRVCAGAAQVQRSLSLLPLSHTATRGAVKFANQATDYAEALLRAGDVTEADADRAERAVRAAVKIGSEPPEKHRLCLARLDADGLHLLEE